MSAFKVDNLVLSVISEDGTQKVTMGEYRTRADLHDKIGLVLAPPTERRTIFCGLTIATFPLSYLDANPRKARMMDELEEVVKANPLKYFVPQADWAVEFLNDVESTMKIVHAPNGTGKSCLGWIDMLLDIVRCRPDWPIFKLHGVRFRSYRKIFMSAGVACVTYEWENHISTIWPQIIRYWTPLKSLGDYAPGGKAIINWKSNPRLEIEGTEVWLHACSQNQTVFEGSARAKFWWDEQGEEDKFNGANMRVRRRQGRHTITCTPHKVKGRYDTGADSFIKKFVTGEMTAGLKVGIYKGGLDEVPSYVFSEEEKRNTKIEWIEEPTRTGNLKKLREGQARVFGDFQESSGLVFDEWAKSIHVIPPMDVPDECTCYRYIDHGRVEPTACLFVAVFPNGDVVAYDEYYQTDRTASENAKAIIAQSGNELHRLPGDVDARTGMLTKRYEERFTTRPFRHSLMDARSMNKKGDDSTMTVGLIYRTNGLRVDGACTEPPYLMVPAAKEYLILDEERTHRITKERGAPVFYVCSNCANFIREIEGFVNEEVTRSTRTGTKKSERPKQENDHLMTCFLFMAADHPEYIQSWSATYRYTPEPLHVEQLIVDPYTGV